MSNLNAKFFSTKILFGLIGWLAIMGLSLISQSLPALALKAECNNYIKGSCISGESRNLRYDNNLQCWLWECVWDNTAACRYCLINLCGNERIDPGEMCDGDNLNGKTCLDQGYDGGTLRCFSDSCSFDESQCVYNARCGNRQLDLGEECDGYKLNPLYDSNQDGAVNCQDFGFDGGILSCASSCLFDKSKCSVCGNFQLEPGEECEDLNFGGKTCASYNCQGGNLTCFACKISKSLCTGCKPVGCQSSMRSDWSTAAAINKPCCGRVNGTYVSSLNASASDLCNAGKQAIDFSPESYVGGVLTSWTWKCGTENCRAYKKAECAPNLASENYGCEPNVIFDSYADYIIALCNRTGTDINQSKSWVDECFSYGVPRGKKGLDSDSSPLCQGGIQTINNTCANNQGGNWSALNKEWSCGWVPVGHDIAENKVNCLTGWSPNSQCGSANGKTYVTGNGVCNNDSQWQTFFGLIDKSDIDPVLCAAGSKVYLPNSKQYSIGQETYDYSGFDNKLPKYFYWQCQYNDGSRKGKPVNCQATLNSTDCTSGDAGCGPAVKKKFAYYGLGPRTGFCQTGKLGGTIVEKVKFNKTNRTWSWICWPQNSKTGQSASCSVTASVFCGPASESGEVYATEGDVKTAGPCAGVKGALFNNKINNKGTHWEWTCVDSTDATVYTVCQAANGQCGRAGGKILAANTFETQKTAVGFLCSNGTMPTPTPSYNAELKVNQWTWTCDSYSCQARKLECGQANNQNYFKDSFEAQAESMPTFLCSSNYGHDKLSYSLYPNPDKDKVRATATWTWDCLGDDGDKINNCSANRYACGWANVQWGDWHSVLKFHDDNWPNHEAVSSWHTAGANTLAGDEFCTYNGVRDRLQSFDTSASWLCQHPDDFNQYEYCRTSYATCGSATGYHDAYYPGAKPYFTKVDLEKHLGKTDGFLCVNSNGPTVIQDNGATLNWICPDFNSNELNKFGSNPAQGICEVNKAK